MFTLMLMIGSPCVCVLTHIMMRVSRAVLHYHGLYAGYTRLSSGVFSGLSHWKWLRNVPTAHIRAAD